LLRLSAYCPNNGQLGINGTAADVDLPCNVNALGWQAIHTMQGSLLRLLRICWAFKAKSSPSTPSRYDVDVLTLRIFMANQICFSVLVKLFERVDFLYVSLRD